MSKITNEQRDAAYEAAIDKQKFLYDSPESGALLWQLATKHDLINQTKYTAFVMVVGDVILGLEKQTNLPTLLSEKVDISFERAIKITGDIIDFLSQTNTIQASSVSTVEKNNVISEPTPTSLESEIAETEAALNAIPKIRTMAQDAHETTAHTSSQADLLNKSNRWTPKE